MTLGMLGAMNKSEAEYNVFKSKVLGFISLKEMKCELSISLKNL